jgi:soluble lytic murein transglycosylase-like protein
MRYALIALLAVSGQAFAGQNYEPLSASVRASLHSTVSDQPASDLAFKTLVEAALWLDQMSPRLDRRIPDERERLAFLKTVHYEATRAGLEPELVLGVIDIESNFKKYAVSRAGARGYMQVMPFWAKLLGDKDTNLFHLRTNLRYGCTILRHYVDIEGGNLYRALGRYNGSLGEPKYPNLVLTAWRGKWSYKTKSS